MEKIRTILLLSNPAFSGCAESAAKLEVALREAGFEVVRSGAEGARAGLDLILLLGGDGFLMDSIRALNYPATRFFGVNFGTVGFLMNPRSVLATLPEAFRAGRFRVEEHIVLEAKVRFRSGQETLQLAFNDFVLERMSGQGIRLLALINGVEFNRYSGDGIIIATPGGSTAYNLAAGGPVVHPGIAAMVLTPLYPHRAAPYHSLQFSLLLPPDRTLRISGSDVDKRPIRLLADGRPYDHVESIEVKDSGRRIRLLRVETHSFISTLSQTFIGIPDPGD
jgi:NAD+ kinase